MGWELTPATLWLSVYNEDHWLLQQWRLWKHWECRISSSFLQFWNPSSHGCKSGMNIIRTQRHDLVRSVFAVFGNTQLLTGPELVYWSLIYMTWSLLPRIHILLEWVGVWVWSEIVSRLSCSRSCLTGHNLVFTQRLLDKNHPAHSSLLSNIWLT